MLSFFTFILLIFYFQSFSFFLLSQTFAGRLLEELKENQDLPTLSSEAQKNENLNFLWQNKALKEFAKESKEALIEVFEKATTEVPPTATPVVKGSYDQKTIEGNSILRIDFDDVFKKLDENAEALGGKIEVPNKRFFGISWEVCQANIRNALKREWSPKFFWKMCARYFDVKENQSCLYSHIKSTLGALKYVQDNFAELKAIFDKDPSAAVEKFQKDTGQIWHPNQNDPRGFFAIINTMAFECDKALTKDALGFFQNAFSVGNCCFPARQRPIAEYYEKHFTDQAVITTFDYPSSCDTNQLIEVTINSLIEEKRYSNDIEDSKKVNLIFTTIKEQITINEQNGAKVNVDIAKRLREITMTDIVQYLCEIECGAIEDYLPEGTKTKTQKGQECYVFEDGSTIPKD